MQWFLQNMHNCLYILFFHHKISNIFANFEQNCKEISKGIGLAEESLIPILLTRRSRNRSWNRTLRNQSKPKLTEPAAWTQLLLGRGNSRTSGQGRYTYTLTDMQPVWPFLPNTPPGQAVRERGEEVSWEWTLYSPSALPLARQSPVLLSEG